MKLETLLKNKLLLVVGLIFIGIISAIVIVAINLGNAYNSGLSEVSTQPSQEYALRKKKDIKRITIRKGDEDSCIEVTPDGVVRVYETCGGELSDAARLNDPKNILKLFKIASETDLAKFASNGTGTLYQLTIETDEGTETITIILNDDSSDFIEDLVETIENIEEDIPDPTPTPNSSSLPSSRPTPGGSPLPSGSANPNSSPSPSPGEGGSPEIPFTCNFAEQGGNKPVRVSNTVCTDEPQQGS